MFVKSAENTLRLTDLLPLLEDIADKRQEHFVVLTLDDAMHVIGKHLVFLGTVNSTLSHPREVFAVAISDAASGIVVCHNHPSGDPNPSTDDIAATQQLIAAGLIIDIPVIEHLIVTRSSYFSFSEHKLLVL